MKTDPEIARVPLRTVCPDYDEDCRSFAPCEARECWLGFPDNPLRALHNIEFEPACGVCPVMAELN
jgi:hypothetical protein